MTLSELIELATEHTLRLAEDVKLASTRMEHVRVTARANEASNLLHALMHYTPDGLPVNNVSISEAKPTDG
jgi:hypothetical protein